LTSPLPERVAAFCRNHYLLTPDEAVVIGVSGGVDSLCLLHLLKNMAVSLNLRLIVAHLNHQLRPEAGADERFVRQTALAWGLTYVSEWQDVNQAAADRNASLEETARHLRYQFLWRVAAEAGAGKVAVGHHADDQAETVLMHFLRGTGLSGLRGMAPATDMSTLQLGHDVSPPGPAPNLIRPLLETSRIEIEAYCQQHALSPRDDFSNQDRTFFRNRLRHDLLPHLEMFNPNIRQVLQRTAKIAAADFELISDHLDQIWPAVTRRVEAASIIFDTQRWLDLSLAMKRLTLRRAVYDLHHSLRGLDFGHIDQMVTLIEGGQVNKQVTLPHRLRLTVGYDTFTISYQNETLPLPDFPALSPDDIVTVAWPGVTRLPQTGWQLRVKFLSPAEVDQDHLTQPRRWELYSDAVVVGQPLILRTRRPGDNFCPFGLAGRRQKISDFMINQKIPADQRDLITLLVSGDQILWVCGYRAAEQTRIRPPVEQIVYVKFEPI